MIAKLLQSGRRRTATLLVADDRLVEECRVGTEQWRRSWALKDLSPDFGLVSARPEHAKARLMGGLAVLGVGLTVYFSTLNAHAPLLAPLVGMVGIWLLVQATRHWRFETWTLIYTGAGEKATHILHRDCRPGERQEFELHLADHIRQAGHGRG